MDWWQIALVAVAVILTFPVWIPFAVLAFALLFGAFAYIGAMLGLIAALAVGVVLAPFVWSARMAWAVIRKRKRR